MLSKTLRKALMEMAMEMDERDVALALLHAQCGADGDVWPHCAEVFLRAVSKLADRCADRVVDSHDDPDARARIAAQLARGAQVLAGLSTQIRTGNR